MVVVLVQGPVLWYHVTWFQRYDPGQTALSEAHRAVRGVAVTQLSEATDHKDVIESGY